MIHPVLKGDNLGKIMRWNWFTNSSALSVLVAVLSYILIFAMVTATIAPKRYDLKVGEVAKETIKATKDIVDQISTKKLIDDAQNAVDIKYKQDETITTSVLQKIASCFDAIDEVRLEGEKEKQRIIDKNASVESGTSDPSSTVPSDANKKDDASKSSESTINKESTDVFSDEFISQMEEKLPIAFSRKDILTILNTRKADLDILQNKMMEVVETALNSGIKEEFRQEQINKINQELLDPQFKISNDVRILGSSMVSAYLQANMIYDREATEEARQKAVDAVQPIMYKKGQNIVRESEPVTEAQLQVLDSLGLLKSKAFDIYLYIGVGILILVLMTTIIAYMVTFEKNTVDNISHLVMLSVIICIVLGLAMLINRINANLIPVSLGSLLITILLRPRLALVVNIVLAVLIGIMTGNSDGVMTISTMNVVLTSIVGGTTGVYMVNRPQQRNALIIAGLFIGVVNFITLLGIGLMTTSDIKGIFISSVWGLGSGLFASILCIGTLPIWEYLFDIITPIKLLELSNPNQPLLKRLLIETPGTYHHSIIVGNLAESAADALQANSLLARVGAYYHDVGKLKRPYFFKENQVGPENPHDKITPNLSTLIITSHPKDGIYYAKKYKIPKLIQDIILQHHGITPVLYFYHKAKNSDNGNEVNINDFRYEGPKPQTREAAIIMMADTVEAAVRALPGPTKGKIEGLIRKLIKEKLEDGQLDECDLTLRDLNTIGEAFAKVLSGIFHERIEYPDVNIKETEGVPET